MYFEAILKDGYEFSKAIEAIGNLVNAVDADVTKEGIRLHAMDPAHVSMIDLFLPKTSFTKFECDGSTALGLGIHSLDKVLQCAKSNDIITIQYDDEEESILQLTFTSPDSNRIVHFSLKLLVSEEERLIIPDIKYQFVFMLSANEFRSICHHMRSLDGTLSISCSAESVTFEVIGGMGRGDVEYKHSSALELNVKENSNCVQIIRSTDETLTQLFAARFLESFSRARSFANVVTLFMDSNAPLVAEFMLQHGGRLKYFLAPKLERD